jgi:ATP diphosphatase
MIQRHPHVFGNENRNKTASQQVNDWETIKAEERAKKNQTGVLDDVALNLPALARSLKLQKRAARVGFDWPKISQVLEKIDEETKELIEAKKTEPQERVNEEFGDLMFSIVNLGRHLKVDPEEALKQTNRKFITRFKFIEESIQSQGKKIEDTSLEELEALWQQAKDP